MPVSLLQSNLNSALDLTGLRLPRSETDLGLIATSTTRRKGTSSDQQIELTILVPLLRVMYLLKDMVVVVEEEVGTRQKMGAYKAAGPVDDIEPHRTQFESQVRRYDQEAS